MLNCTFSKNTNHPVFLKLNNNLCWILDFLDRTQGFSFVLVLRANHSVQNYIIERWLPNSATRAKGGNQQLVHQTKGKPFGHDIRQQQ